MLLNVLLHPLAVKVKLYVTTMGLKVLFVKVSLIIPEVIAPFEPALPLLIPATLGRTQENEVEAVALNAE